MARDWRAPSDLQRVPPKTRLREQESALKRDAGVADVVVADRDRMEERQLPRSGRAAEDDRRRSRDLLLGAVQCVALLEPARDQARVIPGMLGDVAQRRADVSHPLEHLPDVGLELVAATQPPARDLVDTLDIRVQVRGQPLAIPRVERLDELIRDAFELAGHIVT